MSLAALGGTALGATPSALAQDAPYFDETQVTTLFAFDDLAIPFSQGLALEMYQPQRHPDNPVVPRGEPGSVDSWGVQFYGSVLKDQGKYRMWYCAVPLEDRKDKSVAHSERWRIAYAESDDGVHWTKPSLGLVDYRGSTDNNLVKMNPFIGTLNVKVIRDDDDPDPSRRYKMGCHSWFQRNDRLVGTLAPFVSPDGLTWTYLGEVDPVEANVPTDQTALPPIHIEPVGGMFKWDGTFYTSGQNAIPAARPYHGRVTRTFISHDFENWHGASAMGFVREAQHELLGPGRSREGEQIHEGNAVWVRHNMLIGVSGMWHGDGKEWKDVTIDLGFVYSHNGVHFQEALNEWTFIKRGEDGQWDQGGVLQGQGFENIDDQTLIYYGSWDPRNGGDPRGGVGIVTLPRDRFGALMVSHKTKGKGDYQMPEIVSEFITSPVELEGDGPHRFNINADGLGKDATLKIELLTHTGAPIPAYCGDNAAIVSDSGFQTPVSWNGNESIADLPDRIRVKVIFEGKRNTDIRFSAMYVR